MSKNNIAPKPRPLSQLLDMRIIDMTGEEFLSLIKSAQEEPADEIPQIVNGIKGLAQLLGVSRATAQRIKASGDIDPAITQVGHNIFIRADLALELLHKAHANRQKKNHRK